MIEGKELKNKDALKNMGTGKRMEIITAVEERSKT
jgi:hypothetical protein